MQLVYDFLKQVARRIDPRHVEQFLAYSLIEHVYARQLASATIGTRREELWDDLVRRVGAETEVLYLEFGVFEGYSIRYFSERFTHPDSRFVGFDSFEGLPEQWEDKAKGHFSTAGAIPAIADPRVSFRKGWFSQTLPAFLKGLQGTRPAGRSPQVVVHFDADLYSSTLFSLATLQPHFPNYHFCFDEFTGHESRALHNYEQAFGAAARFFMLTGERWRPLQLSGEFPTG
jgi:hypothetical protein